jgi:hypothetical protein
MGGISMERNERSWVGRAAAVAAGLALMAGGGVGCGNGGGAIGGITGTGGGPGNSDGGTTTGPLHPPWTELASAVVSVQGGSASSPAGTAQAGGEVHLLAQTDVTIDPSAGTISAPDIPGAPGDAMAVQADALAADVTAPGSVKISGTQASGGGDAVRTITAGGDIFIEGTLRGADLGGARQGITLVANSGTVYVSGAVDTSGDSGAGQAGGPITINARQVVVTGKLLSSGGDGPTSGGAAGAIKIVTTQAFTGTGTIEAFGGFAKGDGATTGGTAADLDLKAGGDVALGGTIRLRGGAATTTGATTATGGAAATLQIDADGAVTLGGTTDVRGGLATAMTGTATGGAAGFVRVGEKAEPTKLVVLVPVNATGGEGDLVGGAGGTFTPEPNSGTLTIAGPRAVDVSGGSSMSTPGAGGLVHAGPRQDPGSGSIVVSGDVLANGGSVRTGGSGNGGDAGRVDWEVKPTLCAVTVTASGTISADGGNSGGANVAGGGGHVWVFTKDGDLTVAGKVSARGGTAPDPGGKGGLGGMVYFFTDNNHNALTSSLGDLLVDTTGVVDASGGDGETGGDARNKPGGWPVFPQEQEMIAIFFNCDGVHGETMNWMENRGHLIARGGVHNGNGGDVTFHGIGPGQLGTPEPPGGNHHPPSGNVDLAADGTGAPGIYAGE